MPEAPLATSFGTQARFAREFVRIEGRATQWTRPAIAASKHFQFLSGVRLDGLLGATGAGAPGFVTVAMGAFADPSFPPPRFSVYEERQHQWALAAGQLPAGA